MGLWLLVLVWLVVVLRWFVDVLVLVVWCGGVIGCVSGCVVCRLVVWWCGCLCLVGWCVAVSVLVGCVVFCCRGLRKGFLRKGFCVRGFV